MLFAKIENDTVVEFPVFEAWIRQRLPNISFPKSGLTAEMLAGTGYVPVTPVEKPVAKTKFYTNSAEKQANGSWKQKWVSNDKTSDMKAQEKVVLLKELSAIRKKKEHGGATISGMIIDTQPESQHKLHAVRTIAAEHLADPNKPWANINWQGRDGDWYVLTAQGTVDLANGMFMFIEACYTAQKNTEIAIDAETASTVDEVAAEFESELAQLLGA